MNEIGGWWDTKEARNIFAPTSPVGGTDIIVSLRIDLLDSVLTSKNVEKVVNKATECKLDDKHAVEIVYKCLYLRQAYQIALEKIATPQTTWEDCCREAIEKLANVGIKSITGWRTIQDYNLTFRMKQCFPHPSIRVELGRKYTPMLLDLYPEARHIICDWATANIECMSSELIAHYIREELVPILHRMHEQQCEHDQALTRMSIDDMKLQLNIDNFSVSTAYRMLKYLGFKYQPRKKTYYNDKHENSENILARKRFLTKYFKLELKSRVWVQLTEDEAIKLEQEKGLLPDTYYAYGDSMREYHIDTHPSFSKMDPQLSVRKPPDANEMVIMGQDETAIKQHTYSNRCWHDHKGATKLLPKSDGYSLMLSAIVSRKFGLGLHLSDAELYEINSRRASEEWKEYVSKESAMEVYGSTIKKALTDKYALIQYFELGIQNEGYWNYNHIALQCEDIFDILCVKYPHCDFTLLMDHSAGHQKKLRGGLDAKKMKKNWGGKKIDMRPTIVEENGPFPCTHPIGTRQTFKFEPGDEGPFNLTPAERLRLKHDRLTGTMKTRDRTNGELLNELKKKGFRVRGIYTKEQLRQHANYYTIPLTVTEPEQINGWLGANKSLLQVLWERGYINEVKVSKYRLEAKQNQNGDVAEENQSYLLREMMANCPDFRNEKSAIEDLFEKLSAKGQNNIHLLTTPKYHCEIAGEGVEYVFGLMKRFYRSLKMDDKKTKNKFKEAVRKSVNFVKREHVNRFAATCRRYMLAYNHLDGELTYSIIEKFQRKFKTHRNIADQETRLLSDVWRRGILVA